MVLRRKKEEDFEEDDETFDEEEKEEELVIPTPTMKQRTSSPPALPPKVRQEHDAGDIEPMLQIGGFRVFDDLGKPHEFIEGQSNAQSFAECFGRVFKALKEQ